MDDKYVIPKKKKPETRAEILQQKMEELVKQRDQTLDPVEKQALNAQLTKLFAQYEGLRL
jgi:helix-turn-helix protein